MADTSRRIDSHTLAERIRTLRRMRRMNQTELAQRAGVSQATISQIENAERKPGLEVLDAIASALDERLEFLLYGTRSTEDEVPASVQALFRDLQRLSPADQAIVEHHMSLLLDRRRTDD